MGLVPAAVDAPPPAYEVATLPFPTPIRLRASRGGMVNSQADIDALAVGTFTAEISEQSSPPFTPQSFPIIVTIVGSINARVLPGPHGQGEAFAGATVRATGGFEIDQTFEVSTTNGNETVPIL